MVPRSNSTRHIGGAASGGHVSGVKPCRPRGGGHGKDPDKECAIFLDDPPAGGGLLRGNPHLIHKKETGNETSELRVLSCRPPAAGCAGLKTGAPLRARHPGGPGPGREANRPELGVLPAARLRRAVPTGGRRSLASASLRLVACGRDVHHPGTALSCRRAGPPTERMARRHGNADLWAVLPVGPGTAARSAANGVCHAPVRMTLDAGVPAERRTAPELGVLPCRPPAAGCADRRSAFPCQRVALHGGVRPRRAPSRNCTFMPARRAPNRADGAQARERRPLGSSPGGARHRCAKRSERRVPRTRPDDAQRRGPGREANRS